MTDVTRYRDFAEKKTVSVSAARLLHSDVADTALQELFNLPEKCLIIDAGIVVDVAGQGGLTVDFGFAGGNELGNDIALDSTGYKQVAMATLLTTLTGVTALTSTAGTVTALVLGEGTPNTLTSGTVSLTNGAGTCTLTSGAGTATKAPRILTETGKNVTAKFSADPSAGDFTFIVEYIEYTLKNGQRTEYTAH